jgi:photosystem II stability/assembly factor-like uncharacterized protein
MVRKSLVASVSVLALVLLIHGPGSAIGAAPAKTARWVNITPKQVSTNAKAFGGNNYGFLSVTTDPKSGAVYVGTCYQGLWKSTNGGKTWKKVNTGTNGTMLDGGRLWALQIDPVNPQILYTTAGYGSGGVLKSTDGGVSWTDMMAGNSGIGSQLHSEDIYSIAIDPRNHKHILASFHGSFSGGSYGNKSPIIESLDGGLTWKIHAIRAMSYPQFVYFLGNSSTWLVGTVANGYWRTTNAGASWKQVAKVGLTDGGSEMYHAHDGSWYVTAFGTILRSHNGGRSWTSADVPDQPYMGLIGDGKHLYSGGVTAGGTTSDRRYYITAPESSGTHWVQFNSQALFDGPMSMTYDRVHHIIYSSNWRAGVWKLAV